MFRLDASIEPLVVINGVATPGEDAGAGIESSPALGLLSSIPINNIDNIVVLGGSDAAIYGARGGNGVIVVTTSAGGNKSAPDDKGIEKKIYSKSYLESSPFPEPDYSKRNKNKTISSDYRPTIYWNGSTLTNKEGQAIYNFYTADGASVYTVTVTGVTAKGNLIYTQVKINRQ
jgi:outer membrane receptor protein involved in Fe transport